MSYSLTPEQAAERIVSSNCCKIAWSGPRADVVIDVPGGRYVVCEGDSNHAHGFEQAERVRKALKAAILKTLLDFT